MTQETDHLVRMLNQIALNMGENRNPDRALEGCVSHLQRFWTPQMRDQLVTRWQTDAEQLSPVAARVAQRFAEQANA